MQLWLLKNPGSIGSMCDDNLALVVRAEDEEQARSLAAAKAEDEGPDIWHDRAATSCQLLTLDGTAEVILTEVIRHCC